MSGTVAKRLPGTENKRLATGEIELQATEIRILNEAKSPEKRLVAHALPRELRPTTHRVFVIRASNAPEGASFKRLCAMLRAIVRE